jgi:hypothetical protein
VWPPNFRHARFRQSIFWGRGIQQSAEFVSFADVLLLQPTLSLGLSQTRGPFLQVLVIHNHKNGRPKATYHEESSGRKLGSYGFQFKFFGKG